MDAEDHPEEGRVGERNATGVQDDPAVYGDHRLDLSEQRRDALHVELPDRREHRPGSEPSCAGS